MKNILWISRHQMTENQLADLHRLYGDDIAITAYTATVSDISSLLPYISGADVVAAVLPLNLLSKLVSICGSRPVIQSVSARIPTGKVTTLDDGRTEQVFSFSHLYWERVRSVSVITEKL